MSQIASFWCVWASPCRRSVQLATHSVTLNAKSFSSSIGRCGLNNGAGRNYIWQVSQSFDLGMVFGRSRSLAPTIDAAGALPDSKPFFIQFRIQMEALRSHLIITWRVNEWMNEVNGFHSNRAKPNKSQQQFDCQESKYRWKKNKHSYDGHFKHWKFH